MKKAVVDLAEISMAIEKYRTMNGGKPPLSLDELGAQKKDPWGNDYRYLNFSADPLRLAGQIRKDHNLHPLNTEFDLYSSGPDGKSRPPLTAKESWDDIVYARDGNFIGKATDF
jgi:general secretion pathway protein G